MHTYWSCVSTLKSLPAPVSDGTCSKREKKVSCVCVFVWERAGGAHLRHDAKKEDVIFGGRWWQVTAMGQERACQRGRNQRQGSAGKCLFILYKQPQRNDMKNNRFKCEKYGIYTPRLLFMMAKISTTHPRLKMDHLEAVTAVRNLVGQDWRKD